MVSRSGKSSRFWRRSRPPRDSLSPAPETRYVHGSAGGSSYYPHERRTMRGLLRHRPSPAIVIACLALVAALSGTSYAAVAKLLPKNSVGSAQVINGSLQTIDLSKKARTALKGQRGPRGTQGLQGATGATGATGAKGDKGDPG